VRCVHCGKPVAVEVEPADGHSVSEWTCPMCQKTNVARLGGCFVSVVGRDVADEPQQYYIGGRGELPSEDELIGLYMKLTGKTPTADEIVETREELAKPYPDDTTH
jgi:hypothetical protein